MKKNLIESLLCFFVIIVLQACVEKDKYPSPLQGVQIANVYMNADETSRSISFTGDLSRAVVWEATDSATNQKPTWLKDIKLQNGKMDISVEENITIKDRCARVCLSLDPTRTDFDNSGLKVNFNIVQYKNKMFDGLDIAELQMPYTSRDTLISLGRDMINVKIETLPLDGGSASWCKPTLAASILKIHVDAYKSAGVRQALIRLLPNKGNVTGDPLTAHSAILVTQNQNPVFEAFPSDTTFNYAWNLQADTLNFPYALTDIKYVMTDSATQQSPTWLQASVSGKQVILKPQVNNTRFARKATVTLYMPNNGNVIDSTTVQTTFTVRQLQNTLFDNAELGNDTMTWNQKPDTLISHFDLSAVKIQLTDNATQQAPTWLQVTKSAGNDRLIIKPEKLYTNVDRSAKVTLYMNNTNNVDENCAQVSFLVAQQHNDIFDTLKIATQKLAWDQNADTLKFKRTLTDIKCKIIDNITHEDATWMKSYVIDDYVRFVPSVLNAKANRSATVTLYLNNPKNSAIDQYTVKTAFTMVQQHNDIFDNINIADRTIAYNQTLDTLRLDRELKNIRCLIIDNETQQGATWVSAKVSGKEVVFTSKVNSALNVRTATVTLYLLDGKDAESSTVKTSFKLTQNYRTQIQIEEKKVEVDYTEQSVDLHVTSNAKYQIVTPGTWVTGLLKPVDENHEVITLTFSENETNTKHEGDLRLLVSGEEIAKIPLTQQTNPKIEINFDDKRTEMSFSKAGGEFQLPFKTLTPSYKISKNGSWIGINNSATIVGIDQYYHKITIPYFSGDAFERLDTIVISNFNYSVRFPIKQHKYVYLKEATHEVEEGGSFQLTAKTNTGRTILWSSSNENVASVSSSGLVQAVNSGNTYRNVNQGAKNVKIIASIGSYAGVTDYNDYCDVTVYIAPDKVGVARGGGNYEKIEGVITSDCPVIITNNYKNTIHIQSLQISAAKNGSTVSYDLNVKDNDEEYIRINSGDNYTFALTSKLNQVSYPVIKLTFTANGKTYTKEVYY